jgi:hypothetical protein
MSPNNGFDCVAHAFLKPIESAAGAQDDAGLRKLAHRLVGRAEPARQHRAGNAAGDAATGTFSHCTELQKLIVSAALRSSRRPAFQASTTSWPFSVSRTENS